MLEPGVYLFGFWAIFTLLTFVIVRDIAAPVMFVHAGTGVYFSDLYFQSYTSEIYLTFALLVICATLISFLYVGTKVEKQYDNGPLNASIQADHRISYVIWIATLPAIFGQLYMIYMFGGISGYVCAAKWGTKFFHGLGPLKTLIATYAPISLLFFAIIMNLRCSRFLKMSLVYTFLYLLS